jgi:hypothetical protein
LPPDRYFVNEAQACEEVLTGRRSGHYSCGVQIEGQERHMASSRLMIERRRSSRLMARIPVTVFPGRSQEPHPEARTEATAISRCGALLCVPFSPALGTRLEIRHGLSQEMREFRVVRVNATKSDGLFELGVEILHPTRNFWGVQFPDERYKG